MTEEIPIRRAKTIRPALCRAQVRGKAFCAVRRVVASSVGSNPEEPATAPRRHGDLSLASLFCASGVFLKNEGHGHGRINLPTFDTSL